MLEQEINNLDAIPFPLIEITTQGQIVATNAAFTSMFQFDVSTNVNINTLFQFTNEQLDFTELVRSGGEITCIALYQKSLVDKCDVQLSIRPQPQNNSLLTVLVEKSPYWYRQYNLKKQALHKIEHSIDRTSTGLWEYDLGSQQAEFSGRFKELVMVPRDHLLTWQEFRSLVFSEDKGVFDAFLNNHIQFNILLSFEFRIVKNGKVHWFQLKGEAIQDQNRARIIMGSLTDCTEIKKTIAKLNDTVESKDIAMKAGNIGTWRAECIDGKRWRWRWDELANQMFMLNKEDIGKINKLLSLLHPEDSPRIIAAIENSLKTGEFFNEHYRVILANGELKYILGKGKVSKNFNGNSYRIDGICIDQTLIYKVQHELELLNNQLEQRVLSRTRLLEKAKEQAEQASQTKTDFLSMMSHELRTPMNAVIGSLDLLSTTELSVESLDLLDTAKTSANNLVFILNDILDINKIEAGKLELEESAFSVSEVIDNIVKVFIPVLSKQNVQLVVIEDPQIPRFVKGDATRVRQILFNILGNAIKFTGGKSHDKGVIKLIARVEESNQLLSHISFVISDNGIGIAKDVQQKLFSPFTQAERSTTRKYGGTGLGLNICGKLTEMMGGEISLKSKLGEGTTFTINLPLWISQETTALEVETLTGTNVAILSMINDDLERVYNWTAYLAEEGASVKLVEFDHVVEHSDEFDVVIILANYQEAIRQQVASLYQQVKNSSNICCAIQRNEIALFREFLPGVKLLPVCPITRVQLIDTVKQIKLSNQTLTLDDLDLSELALSLEETSTESTHLKGGILVVEDNPLNQKLIKKQMKHIGYACDIANNGEEGITQWQNKRYKLILTDCHMPLVDGYDMTKSIRAQEKQKQLKPIPIIAITGAAMTGDEQHCFDSGMNDFVSKPMQMSDLKEVLKKWYKYEQ
ncbi:hypothetical protein tinsulaeT_37460 [Thalassotalea insulae]|uniref:histidine kinase n=1 Tax=Thalassotalea insulae TaxID=2056778 RepID=A0ABQ6H1W1_9GAMM|nr:PAS domain-containing hybrid sensor histidine kinase/response regulator [Thalassotalea insulae]GLX80406.1 hypothetical protein tinsulaeT_37460 [Thalassotalea insulae]